MAEQERMVEAILFATADPITVAELSARMPHGCDPAEALVYLRKRYERITSPLRAPRSRKFAVAVSAGARWTNCLKWNGSVLDGAK